MHALLWLWFLAAPFWESRPPAEWTEDELEQVFVASPWAQEVGAPGTRAGSVIVYLATAGVMRAAEEEWRRRHARKGLPVDPSWEEYTAYLSEHGSTKIVVAVAASTGPAFADGEEMRMMNKESRLRIGRRRYAVVGHFPPTALDPFLRLVFQREIQPGDKELQVDLYVPGLTSPFRQVSFRLKQLVFRGQPDF